MAASDVRAGRAFVELTIRRAMFTKGLNAASARLKAFGASASAVGRSIFAFGAAGVAAFGVTVKAASDSQQVMSKFNIVFGDSSRAIEKWGDALAETIGRSKGQVAEFMAGTQDLFVPLGFASGAAEELSKKVVKLTFDLASFNNRADADVHRDLQAAMTGSSAVMKKYGVVVNAAAVKQQLLNEGIDPTKATQQEKVMARLNIIMAGTKAAHGNAASTSGEFANVLKGIRGAAVDTASEIGTHLLPILSSTGTNIVGVIRSIGDFAKENKGLILSGAGVVVAIAAVGGILMGLGVTATLIGIALGGIASVIGVIASAVGLLFTPLGAAVAILVGSVAAWLKFTDSGKAALASIIELFKPIRDAIGGIINALQTGDFALAGQIAMAGLEAAFFAGMEAIVLGVGFAIEAIIGWWTGPSMSGGFQAGIDVLTSLWTKFAKGLVWIFGDAGRAVLDLFQETTEGIAIMLLEASAKGGVTGAIANMMTGIDMADQQSQAELHRMQNIHNTRQRIKKLIEEGGDQRVIDDQKANLAKLEGRKVDVLADARKAAVASVRDSAGEINSTVSIGEQLAAAIEDMPFSERRAAALADVKRLTALAAKGKREFDLEREKRKKDIDNKVPGDGAAAGADAGADSKSETFGSFSAQAIGFLTAGGGTGGPENNAAAQRREQIKEARELRKKVAEQEKINANILRVNQDLLRVFQNGTGIV